MTDLRCASCDQPLPPDTPVCPYCEVPADVARDRGVAALRNLWRTFRLMVVGLIPVVALMTLSSGHVQTVALFFGAVYILALVSVDIGLKLFPCPECGRAYYNLMPWGSRKTCRHCGARLLP